MARPTATSWCNPPTSAWWSIRRARFSSADRCSISATICRKADSRSRIRTRSRIVPAAKVSLHDRLLRAPRSAATPLAGSGGAQGNLSRENARAHPDATAPASGGRFAELNEAYQVLQRSKAPAASSAESGKARRVREPVVPRNCRNLFLLLGWPDPASETALLEKNAGDDQRSESIAPQAGNLLRCKTRSRNARKTAGT